jgi:hypothetical protein
MDWPYFTGAPLAANGEAVGSVHHLLGPWWLDPHQIAQVARIGGRHHPVLYTQLTVTELQVKWLKCKAIPVRGRGGP